MLLDDLLCLSLVVVPILRCLLSDNQLDHMRQNRRVTLQNPDPKDMKSKHLFALAVLNNYKTDEFYAHSYPKQELYDQRVIQIPI